MVFPGHSVLALPATSSSLPLEPLYACMGWQQLLQPSLATLKPRCVGASGVARSCLGRSNPRQRFCRYSECGSEGCSELWAGIIPLPPNPFPVRSIKALLGPLKNDLGGVPLLPGSEGGAVLGFHCLAIYLGLLTQLVRVCSYFVRRELLFGHVAVVAP